VYVPDSFEAAVLWKFVSILVTTTAALGTIAPEASATVPVMVPNVV
jgi:hypothetical protein